MSALGVLFGVGTALGTHGASEGWVCSPVRQYVGIANITKNDMHAIHAFDTAHHTWTCFRGSIAGYVTVFWDWVCGLLWRSSPGQALPLGKSPPQVLKGFGMLGGCNNYSGIVFRGSRTRAVVSEHFLEPALL